MQSPRGHIMRKLIYCALLAVASFSGARADSSATTAQLATKLAAAAISCPAGLVPCGTSGCYRPGFANCSQGTLCNAGMVPCLAGTQGAGGCYQPSAASCTQGRICSSG